MGEESSKSAPLLLKQDEWEQGTGVWRRTLVESKMLWRIIGPAIISRLATVSYSTITQAFAGHMADTELAAISILMSVICGFDYGFMFGMASALDTLCGQSYGAKQYNMMGVYLQRSWVVLLAMAVVLLPLYVFAAPLLKLLGQPEEVADLAGYMAFWIIPMHFSFAFIFPLQRFLQTQVKNAIYAYGAIAGLVVHVAVTWLAASVLDLGVVGIAAAQNISWWVWAVVMLVYTVSGGCPLTWRGFTMQAFSGLWDFMKLSASSGVMICLENWYYRILVLMTGNMKNAEIAISALSVCMSINGWEMSIPLTFCNGTRLWPHLE